MAADSATTLHVPNVESRGKITEDGEIWAPEGVLQASAQKRAAAYLLDLLVIEGVLALLTAGRSISTKWAFSLIITSSWPAVLVTWIGFLGAHGVYFQLTGIWIGRSLGQRWFRLAVVNADATPLSDRRWGKRSWAKLIYAFPLIGPLGFGIADLIRINRSENHQSLVDRRSSTIVAVAYTLPLVTRRHLG